ncbi:formate dehydrogenase accessory sulfurtransferase FdhD [Hyphobacterium marinum]|uniref:Formate dehydrogenase accessory sulfurtransferase FdhD n=1 Tax=Hyphobacterium marinum TaxID=3116574 RepID=A0ABU7LVV3_9PROT|nr:formate dehydrogenase accessory sulfurtransferase FdhD [Hyphobacterium sp. Y6023]MEE2565688.1 formate dehydrogenase accessory sulfurtransferase FdhD [Hyphobacterium sp. Y6023]
MAAFPDTKRDIALPGGGSWGIAEEVPVEIGFNGTAWTVMMATPADLEDLAIGLALTEQIITDAGAVEGLALKTYPEGITADIRIAREALTGKALRRRTLDGQSGCGLCGLETLAEAIRRPAPRSCNRTLPGKPAILKAFYGLAAAQPLNAATRSVHAAAWCAPHGAVSLVREDVGRHNALDKLVGALAHSGQLEDNGFIVMSSRCSFELVCKAAITNASLLATVSAPTGLALDLSRELGLPLACRSGEDAILFNSGTE